MAMILAEFPVPTSLFTDNRRESLNLFKKTIINNNYSHLVINASISSICQKRVNKLW